MTTRWLNRWWPNRKCCTSRLNRLAFHRTFSKLYRPWLLKVMANELRCQYSTTKPTINHHGRKWFSSISRRRQDEVTELQLRVLVFFPFVCFILSFCIWVLQYILSHEILLYDNVHLFFPRTCTCVWNWVSIEHTVFIFPRWIALMLLLFRWVVRILTIYQLLVL